MATPEMSRYADELSEDDYLALAGPMHELSTHPAWLEYLEVLKGSRVSAREQALDGPLENVTFWKGYVEGLRAAADIPKNVVEAALRIGNARDSKGKGQDRILRSGAPDAGDLSL